jgi:hypothetical protein
VSLARHAQDSAAIVGRAAGLDDPAPHVVQPDRRRIALGGPPVETHHVQAGHVVRDQAWPDVGLLRRHLDVPEGDVPRVSQVQPERRKRPEHRHLRVPRRPLRHVQRDAAPVAPAVTIRTFSIVTPSIG